jgi:hypothetical protein
MISSLPQPGKTIGCLDQREVSAIARLGLCVAHGFATGGDNARFTKLTATTLVADVGPGNRPRQTCLRTNASDGSMSIVAAHIAMVT